jgi:A/G-specific adenine glycosylase
MELGATVCKPKSPSCHMCPMSGHCAALARANQAQQDNQRKLTSKRNKREPLADLEDCVAGEIE